jgi:hypothetical protein
MVGGRDAYRLEKEGHTMSLQSTRIALLLLLIATCAYSQEQPESRYITGKEGAAGGQVVINETNTDPYPQVRIITIVLADNAAQEQTLPSSGDAPCYDDTALQPVVASLRKNEERFAKSLINSIERDQRRQRLVGDFDRLMAQGPGTGTCLLQQLGLVQTLFNDQLINSIQRDASRQQLYTKLHDLCLPQATDVSPIADCLTLMNGAFEQDLINSIQRDASRQMLWKALHDVLLARAQTDAEIDQALDVVNQLYKKDLINSIQRDETRKALSQK